MVTATSEYWPVDVESLPGSRDWVTKLIEHLVDELKALPVCFRNAGAYDTHLFRSHPEQKELYYWTISLICWQNYPQMAQLLMLCLGPFIHGTKRKNL